MFSSKFFLAVGLISLLLLGGAFTLQIKEMQEYNLLSSLQQRLLGSPAEVQPEVVKEGKEDKKTSGDAVAVPEKTETTVK